MKKLLLVLLFVVAAQVSAWSQNGYTFSQTTGTYTDLVNPTLLTGGAIWDDSTFTVPLGFNFTINNETSNSVLVNSNGVILITSLSSLRAMLGFEADLADRGTTTGASPISYQTTGTPGSQVTKIEFKNAGFYDPSPTATTLTIPGNFINLQLWLYEGSNRIEVHIGASTITSIAAIFGSATGPGIGVVTDYNIITDDLTGLFLAGTPANATATAVTMAQSYPNLNGVPATGTIYAFAVSGSVGLPKTLQHAKIEMYPNPATDVLKISGISAGQGLVQIRIYDVLGKVVLTYETTNADILTLPVHSLKRGSYFAEIISGNQRAGQQIIKL